MAARTHPVDIVALWLVCVLCAVCQAAPDLSGEQLPFKVSLTNNSVSASAECGKDASGKVVPTPFNCKENACSKCGVANSSNYSAGSAVDGNPATSWQSPPLSSSTNYSRAYLTADLGWGYLLSSINLVTGNSPLPHQIVVLISRDGISFSPSAYYVDTLSRCPNFTIAVQSNVTASGVAGVICTDGLAYGEKEINISLLLGGKPVEAQYVRLEFSDPTGNESDPTQLFFSISELSIFVTCPQVLSSDNCFAPNVVRHITPSLQPDQVVRLLWQQDGLSFPGEWYLNDLSLAAGTCPKPWAGSATCLQPLGVMDTCSSISATGGSCTMGVPCGVAGDNSSKLYFDGSGLRQALSGPINIGKNQTARFDIGFVSYPPQCMPRVSPIEVRACPGLHGTQMFENCSLVSIISSGECGDCVDQLLLQLVNLTEVMNASLLILPNVYLDGANVTSLYDRIMQLTDNVNVFVASIYVDGVVIGVFDAVPTNVTVPSSVFRLDRNLTHSLLYLIAEVNVTLVSLDKLSLSSHYTNVSARVKKLDVDAVLKPASQLLNLLNASLNTVISFVSAISINLTRTDMAVAEGNLSLVIIQRRDFTSTALLANSTLQDANKTLVDNEGLYREATRINASTNLLFERVLSLFVPLLQLKSTEVVVGGALQNTTVINDAIKTLLVEIKALSLEASSLNVSVHSAATVVSWQLAQGSSLIDATSATLQNVTLALNSLDALLKSLGDLVTKYNDSLMGVVTKPCNTSGGVTEECTAGQLYAGMLLGMYDVMNSLWVPTQAYGQAILALYRNISQLIDFNILSRTTQSALDVSNSTLTKLSIINATQILLEANSTYDESKLLFNESVIASWNATVIEGSVNSTATLYSYLLSNYSHQAAAFKHISDDAVALKNTANYTQLANALALTNTVILSNLSNATAALVYLEEEVRTLDSNVSTILDIVANTTFILNYTSFESDMIEEFINESRAIYATLDLNISSILLETQLIIGEIDSIVSDLGSLYNDLNKINAPVVLSPGPVNPYVSLQPPPGSQMANGSIQFESLDLFLTSSPSVALPALLFYAGPLTYENNSASLQEDYFFITAETSLLHLRWQLGYYSGDLQLPAAINGDMHISVARVGSLFQFQYSVGTLGPGNSSQLLVNNSITFHTSNATIFLIGGKPDNALLTPGFTMAGKVSSFYGQYEMVFFNGQQWGLWNVRSTSKTNLIGQFLRNQYVTPLVWHGISPRPRQPISALAFDGTGYLFVPMFYNGSTSASPRIGLTFYLHPYAMKKSLIAFMYDQKGTTLELAMLDDGSLVLGIRNSTFSLQQSIPVTTSLSVLFVPSTLALQINGKPYTGTFFQKLSDVKAWFGGIDYYFVSNSPVPRITNSSYSGCLEISVNTGSTVNAVFSTDSTPFINNYLNSPYQKGFSVACFSTIYTRVVGFNGGAYLQYASLPLVSKPEENLPAYTGFATYTVVAISFTPVQSSGVLFILTDPSTRHKLYAALANGTLLVGITNGSSNSPVSGLTKVSLNSTNYLLVSLNTANNSKSLSFYLNGVLDGVLSGIQIKAGTSASNAVLYLGGASRGVVSALDSFPYYVGCLSDLTYGFRAVDLGSPVTKSANVSLSTCPYFANLQPPSLEVEAPPPFARSCLPQAPVELTPSQGAFLATTQLLANDVLGLFGRSWSLGFSLKYTLDGHVLSIQSLLGHSIAVSVGGARLVLEAYVGGVKMASSVYPTPIAYQKFVNVVILCSVDGFYLSCSLQLNGVSYPGGVVQVPYTGTVFVPLAPIIMGATNNLSVTSTPGFTGCLSDLNVNGDASGFSQVKTLIPCFNNTETGYGFTGTSQIAWPLPSSSGAISVVFRPLLDNGLLLLLSSGSQPVLAIGLFNGSLLAANFSRSGSGSGNSVTRLTSQPLCSVGTPTVMDYTLNITYSFSGGQLGSITALVTSDPGSYSTFLLANVPAGGLVLTLGGTPGAMMVPAASKWFSFLLSNNVDQDSLPPSFKGCIRAFYLNGAPLSLLSATTMSGVLVGYCPAAG